MLPAGNSLRNYLPDLDDLLENPAEYLGVGPVVIGPRRMSGLAALFGTAGVAILLSYWFGKRDEERILLGVGLLIGASIWLGGSLWARGHSLILHSDGVEVKYFNLSVWCPWALFHAEGVPHVPEDVSPLSGLILPVAADAVPYIELRRDESVLAHGTQVRARQFTIVGEDEVVLTGLYEVASKDLGDLLLHIGHSSRSPVAARRAAARGVSERSRADCRSGPGRLDHRPRDPAAVSADLLRLWRCDDRRPAASRCWSRGGQVLRVFMPGTSHEVAIAVPVCEACQTAVRERQSRGAVRGMLAGFLVGPLTLLLGGWGDLATGILGVAELPWSAR